MGRRTLGICPSHTILGSPSFVDTRARNQRDRGASRSTDCSIRETRRGEARSQPQSFGGRGPGESLEERRTGEGNDGMTEDEAHTRVVPV